jgi:hypothetical protein
MRLPVKARISGFFAFYQKEHMAAPLNITDLNNGKKDLDHIAEVATSEVATATDRLGRIKLTVQGAVDTLKAFNVRGAFVTATAYALKDVYTSANIAYVTVSAHVSTTVAADIAAGRVMIHQGATKEELASIIGAALLGYANGGTAVTAEAALDLLYFGVANVRNKRFAGGASANGIADDTPAFIAATASLPLGGTVFIPPGDYQFAGNTAFTGLQNITWEGVGFASKVKILTGDLIFKSPIGFKLSRLWFIGNNLNAVQQSLWISNFTDASVLDCKFSGFGGGTFNKAGSSCLYMTATDTTTAQAQAGNSKGAVVQRCVFEGNGRLTNFGLRLYSDFVVVGVATNTGAIISGCTFNEINWNALELAGPGVSGAVVSNCVANLCGLCPFDIDKGAHGNKMSNLTINRLLGNIDPIANPNTRAGAVGIAGSLETGPYAYNNHVDGVTINLLAADVAAYQGRGMTAVTLSFVRDSTVKNVRMYCDAVPAHLSSAAFALAAVCFETCSGVTVDGVETVNASNGIIEVGTFNPLVGANPVRIQNITNVGTMKGEVIYAPNSTYGTNRYLFSEISMSTDMSDPQSVARNSCVVLDNPNVGNGNLGCYILHKLRIYCSNATSYGIYAGAYKLAIDDISIGLTSQARFFAPASPMQKLFASTLGSSMFGNDALDVSIAFANLAATCGVNVVACGDAFPLIPGVGDGRLYTSGPPTNPPNALWVRPATLDYLNPVSLGYMGLVQTAAGWKQFGAIL